MIHLKESKEFFQVKLRPLNKFEINYIEKFIEIMKITFDFAHTRKKNDVTDEEFEKFLKDITPYLKYDFCHVLKKFKDSVEEQRQKLNNIKNAEAKDVDEYLKTHQDIINALKDNNLDKAIELNTSNRLDFLDSLYQKRKGLKKFALGKFSNPFQFESNFLFYNKDSLVHNFSSKEIDALIEIFKNNKWTDSKQNLANISDPNTLLYAIQNLKPAKDKVRVDKNVDDWLRFSFKNDPNYENVLKLVNDFLHSNNKKILKEVMSLVNKIPLLKKANDKLKNSIKTVYRGVAIHDEDHRLRDNDIIAKDRKEDFVSTSVSKHAAKNFALAKGHLESEDSRRSKEGVILEYTVDNNSIILCVEIFGSVFGEREIIIDPKKAKVNDLEWI